MAEQTEPSAKRQCMDSTQQQFYATNLSHQGDLTMQLQGVALGHEQGAGPGNELQPLHEQRTVQGLILEPPGPGPSSARDRERLAPGAYSQREEALIKREQDGDIAFKYVLNNDDPQNLMYLVGLKNIFSKQLPNMPKEYIVRLVFDRRHRSVALLKRNGTVIGGITYRAFHAQAFGEIAFCAVTSHEQVKGYGTRLMNQTKEFARTQDRLTHFLTYADNNAVGYFEKQGFTREISLDRERWHGYIKDYDGGTLMECVMHPAICFTALPALIATQRLALDERVRHLSSCHVVQPGLRGVFSAANEGAAVGPAASAVRQRYVAIPIGDIPGVREAGWSSQLAPQGAPRYRLVLERRGSHGVGGGGAASSGTAVEPSPANLRTFLGQVMSYIKSLEDSWPFQERVAVEDAPDYYDIIKDPIALDDMDARLASGAFYLTLEIFTAELRRIFDNCRFYNAPDTIYYKLANKLEAAVNTYLNAHVLFEEGDGPGVGTSGGPGFMGGGGCEGGPEDDEQRYGR